MNTTATFALAVCGVAFSLLNILATVWLAVLNYRLAKQRDSQGFELASDKKPEAFRNTLYTRYFDLIREISTVAYDVLQGAESYYDALPHQQWFLPIYDQDGNERVTIEEQEQALREARLHLNEQLKKLWQLYLFAHAVLDPESLIALVEYRRKALNIMNRQGERHLRPPSRISVNRSTHLQRNSGKVQALKL